MLAQNGCHTAQEDVASHHAEKQTGSTLLAHRFSQRLAENRRWTVPSSSSALLARYALISWPMAVVLSGKFHSSAGTCMRFFGHSLALFGPLCGQVRATAPPSGACC